jgi:hypothetical protein
MKITALAILSVLALGFAASAQSVVSTHSGVVYFFEGSVFLGGQPLEQKFGRFPDVGEGGTLRSEHGRAEVLLTPGVVLRLDEKSAIRMVSDKLSDTRVELLGGSAILESSESNAGTSVKLSYKDWHVRVPKQGVYRIDADPAQVRVYKGEAEVSASGETETVAVRDGEVLPLAAILVTERSAAVDADAFKSWAMGRSDAIASDNAIAAGIVDDPSKIEASGLDGGFSYFPLTGVPSLGIVNPYGLSFWSPYQSTLSSIYLPMYRYRFGYLGWPSGIRYFPRPIAAPSRIGPGTGFRNGMPGHAPFTPLPHVPPVSAPRGPASHAGVHAGRR